MVETDNHTENSCTDTDYTVKQRSIRQNGSTNSEIKPVPKPKNDVRYFTTPSEVLSGF